MLEIIFTILAIVLVIKAITLAVKVGWGATKVVATVLLCISCPLLALLLFLAGGFSLLVPVALIVGAIGLLKKKA